jgi:iron complex outermembrane receptor protein
MRVRKGKECRWAARLTVVSVTALLTVAVGQAEPDKAVLEGAVLDPSGLGIPGVTLTLLDPVSGISRTAVSGRSGLYRLPDLPAGTYHLKAAYPGFAPYAQDVALGDNGPRQLNVTLQLPAMRQSVTVATQAPDIYLPQDGSQRETDDSDQARSRNTAELLGDLAGVSLRQNGEFAAVPLLHGMGDERTNLVVNGMTVSASCPNHMNPPLSYIDPSNVAKVTVMAGITPVSMGGDSIGGTVSIDAAPPVFAKPGEDLHEEGVFSSFFRSNGEDYGGFLSGWVATPNLSLGYSGSWATNGDYTDGSGHEVTSTYAQTTTSTVTLAAQGAGNLVVLEAGLHHAPYEGFPSEQMDLTRNYAEFLNLHYRRALGWGVLDSRVYWQDVWHEMNIGQDKSTFPMPMWMPMDTHGRDLGYSVKLAIPLSDRHTLQVGNEFHHFVLDDDWPAVPGAAPMMGPNTFVNINDGRRIRLAWFAEVATKWNSKWTTLLGIRNDTVWTNAGPVSGYSDMYAADAGGFNSSSRSRADIDLDATALARYEPNASSTYEIGYARKTRAPSLYERYAWSTNWMTSGMINWFGDGNYYVGNVDLKPEVAHTVSATASWHDRARKEWEIRVTPYQSYIRDYIDVDLLGTQTYGESTFSQLRFANHSARIYGVDVDGDVAIWDSARFGRGEICGVAGWLHGERIDTGTALYQMMPLNARVRFDEKLKGWTGGLGMQLVDRKSDVDPLRFEQRTPGFALLNLHAGYQWRRVRIDAGADNLLNRCYELPLGGVNFDDYMASGWTSQIRPLTGPGRSLYTGLTFQF